MYRIVAHKYPNNEIRVTWSSLPHPTPEAFHDISPEDNNNEACPPVNSSSASENPTPLSLVPNSKSSPHTAGFGALPARASSFGINAKRQLIRRGAAMEDEALPEECLFLTGTLPGSTENSFRAIAEWSSYIVHRLKAWIANYVRAKLDFYCWEYQKRGALHLHYCVHVPDCAAREMILGAFRPWWISILHRVGEKANADLFRRDSGFTHLIDESKVRAVAEVCRKSPARYLAKYLSKSCTPNRGHGRFFTPARFWGTSRPLKALCDRLTECVEIIEGGYQRIRLVWESVSHACASSDSVTYGYRHKVGVGHTFVSYPNTREENECLMESLRSLSPMKAVVSVEESLPPSQVLKTLKIQQMRLFGELLATLPETQTGLRNALTSHLNRIIAITPSSSPEPLSILLAWMARTADIAYSLRSCRNIPLSAKKQIDEALDIMDKQLNIVADKGWF